MESSTYWALRPLYFGVPHILGVLNLGIIHELTNNSNYWIDQGMGYRKNYIQVDYEILICIEQLT